MLVLTNTITFIRAVLSRIGRVPRRPDDAHVRMLRDLQKEQEDDLQIRTWRELDGDAVFQRVDYCVTPIGRQYLYARLYDAVSRPQEDEAFRHLIQRLELSANLQQRCRETLSTLAAADFEHAVIAAAGVIPQPRGSLVALLVAQVIGVVGSIAWFTVGGTPAALVVAIASGVIARAMLYGGIAVWFPNLRTIAPLSRAHARLSGITQPAGPPPGGSRPFHRITESLSRLLAWTVLRDEDPRRLALDYLVLVVPFDLLAAALLMRLLPTRKTNVWRSFEAIGVVDVALSTMALRSTLSTWTEPLQTTDGVLDAVDLVHPLISGPLPLSVRLTAGSGIVLTGPHMSGKSTLLRSLGTGVLTGNAINTVFAKHWSGPPLHVASMMAATDALTAGESLHQVEVDCLIQLLRLTELVPSVMVLLDEPLRGTNSNERLAVTSAIVRKLVAAGALVLLATHDTELQVLLDPLMNPAHLEARRSSSSRSMEHITLHPGRQAYRSAIALLEERGAPSDVVQDARDLSADLDEATDKS